MPCSLRALLKLCRMLLLAPALLLATIAAHAQTGIYVEYGAGKLDYAHANWMYGPTVGLYFDKGHLIFLSTGVDLRAAFLSSGSSTKLDSGLIGPRLAFRPHVLPLSPYVEGLIGVGHAEYGQGVARTSGTQFEYQLLGGMDLTILPRLDWRVAEFSYGGISVLNGGLHPKTISTGLVLRLPFL